MSLSLKTASFTDMSPVWDSPFRVSSEPTVVLEIISLPRPRKPAEVVGSLSTVSELGSMATIAPPSWVLWAYLGRAFTVICGPPVDQWQWDP